VENETLIYICKNKACYQPVNNVTDALEIMKRLLNN